MITKMATLSPKKTRTSRSVLFAYGTSFGLFFAWGQLLISCTSSLPNVSSPEKKKTESRSNIDENALKEPTAKIVEKEKFDADNLFNSDTLIDAIYKIETATFGAQTCTGDTKLKIYSKLKNDQPLFSIPEGELNCGVLGKVDLKPILNSFAVNPKDGNSEISNNFLRIRKANSITYTPSRPILPAFLSASKEQLNSLQTLTKHEAYDEEKDVTSEGVIEFNMVSTGQEYRSTELRHTFQDVMHFNVVCSGFEGTEKFLSYCYDLAEWHIALNPLAILRIKFVAPASMFIDSLKKNPELGNSKIDAIIKGLPTGGGGGILDDLVGADLEKTLKSTKVEMVLVLIDQKNLGTDEQKNNAQDNDDKVVVGSKDGKK